MDVCGCGGGDIFKGAGGTRCGRDASTALEDNRGVEKSASALDDVWVRFFEKLVESDESVCKISDWLELDGGGRIEPADINEDNEDEGDAERRPGYAASTEGRR